MSKLIIRYRYPVTRFPLPASAHALEKLWPQSNRVDVTPGDVDIGRIGLVRERTHEEPVSSRLERIEYESSDAVSGGGSMWCVRAVAGSSRENRIVRECPTGIRERADHSTNSGSQRRRGRQPRRYALGMDATRAAANHQAYLFLGTPVTGAQLK